MKGSAKLRHFQAAEFPRRVMVARAAKRGLCFFLFGACLASFGDAVHVLTGTTSYSGPPAFFGIMPTWAPVLFGVSGLLMGFCHPQIVRLLERRFCFNRSTTWPKAAAS